MGLVYLALLGAVIVLLWVLGARRQARYRTSVAQKVRDAAETAKRDETARSLQKTSRQLWIAKSGTPAAAHVIAAKARDALVDDHPLVDLALEVQGPDGRYPLQMTIAVPLSDVPSLQPGRTINVRIDPTNRHEVVVLF
jgi:hypothetical protein